MLNHHRVSLCARLLFLVALVCCCCCSSSSVVSATPTATASIVAPPKVDLNEATGSAKVQLSLSKKPLISVSLQLQSPCLRISVCSVLFTPLNWNVPKTVTVFIDSTFNTTCCPLQIKAVGDLAFLNKQAKVDVCKLKVAASVGGSYGDPHVYTLDGVAVNALARGDFYLLREFTGEFAVQVRQSQCGGASCNTAIAMKYRGCVVYVYTSETGSPTISIYGSSADAGVVVAENNDVVTFIAPNQAQITVVLRKYGGKYYLYVTFKAPASLGGQVAGLCGFFDGNKANDLRLPDGTIASSDLDFNLGWAVPTAQNLFLDASATIPPIFGASAPGTGPRFGRICRATILPIPGDLSFLDGLLDFSPLKDLLVPPSNPNPPNCDSLVAGLTSATHPAKLACNAVFNTAAAVWCKNKGVKVDAFLKACLCDFVIMGGASFAVDSQQAYLDRCEAEVTARGVVYPY